MARGGLPTDTYALERPLNCLRQVTTLVVPGELEDSSSLRLVDKILLSLPDHVLR